MNTVPVVYWGAGTQSCTSMGDTFSQTDRTYRITNLNPAANLVFDAQQTELVNNRPTPLSVTLVYGQTNALTGISYSITGCNTWSGTLTYSITMGTYQRSGQLSIIANSSSAQLSDSSVQLDNSVSITFSAEIIGTNLVILYTSNGATNGIMKYIDTYWKF